MSGNREPILFKVLRKSEETGGYTKFRSLHSGYSSSPNPTAANETATRITESGAIKPAVASQPLAATRASMTTTSTPTSTIAGCKRSFFDIARKSLRGNSTGILISSTSPATPKRSESVIVNNRTITCLPNDAKRRLSSTSLVPVIKPIATSKGITGGVRLVLTPAMCIASPSINTSPQQQQQQQQQQNASIPTANSNKMTVCIFCGGASMNSSTSDSCHCELDKSKQPPIVSNAGSSAKKKAPSLPECPIVSLSMNFYGNKSSPTAGSRAALPPFRDRSPVSMHWCMERPKPAKTRSTVAKSSAPVVLILSSDDEGQDVDEEDENLNENGMSVDDGDVGSVTVAAGSISKEPSHELSVSMVGDIQTEKGSPSPPTNASPVTVQCRLRIGSYKVVPQDPMVIDLKSIQLKVPTVSNEEEVVTLFIPMNDISKLLVHLGRDLPSLFLELKPICAAYIRCALRMEEQFRLDYNPESDDELVKRLIILPEELNDDQRNQLTKLFKEMSRLHRTPTADLFIETISKPMVNKLLIVSSPPEARDDLIRLSKKSTPLLKTPRKVSRTPVIRQSLRLQKQNPECATLATYPLPPIVGGIYVTTEDMRCLEPGEFLNDVIIDFYLKYLFGEILTEDDRNRTHIFSSFFFKRLTNSDMPSEYDGGKDPVKSSANKALSMAETRHSRVKNWTRNVNIFEKDFVIIPISENSHWFLVVICFAHLVGLVGDEESCPPPSAEHDYESEILEDSLFGDELNGKEVKETSSQLRSSQNSVSDERGISRRPCILIFDSLRTHSSWNHVFRLLREYLAMEYQHKMHSKREFSKETIRAGYPNVPQQTNYSDCGIFVLQYVESFFKNPIQNFKTPIRGVDNWFSSEEVCKTKRKEIKDLILRLHKEQTN